MRTYVAATGFLKTIRRCLDEVRADILLMPCHKEQHYNDKMVCRWDNRNYSTWKFSSRPRVSPASSPTARSREDI